MARLLGSAANDDEEEPGPPAPFEFVEEAEDVEECRFPASGRPHDGDALPSGDTQADIPQYLPRSAREGKRLKRQLQRSIKLIHSGTRY